MHRSEITERAVSTQFSLNDLPGYLSAVGEWLWTGYYRLLNTGINTQNQWATSREQQRWTSKLSFRANRLIEAVLGLLALATFRCDSLSMLAGIPQQQQQRNILYEFPALQDFFGQGMCICLTRYWSLRPCLRRWSRVAPGLTGTPDGGCW